MEASGMDTLQDVGVEIAAGMIPLVFGAVSAYLAGRGWKLRVLGRIVARAVEKVAEERVRQMKTETLNRTGHYDLTPGQAYEAKQTAVAEVAAAAREADAAVPKLLRAVVPKIAPAAVESVELHERIEAAVRERKTAAARARYQGLRPGGRK